MANEILFNEYTKVFDKGMEAFNNGDAKEAKSLFIKASEIAIKLSEDEKDEKLKSGLVEVATGLMELIDMHLKEEPETNENVANNDFTQLMIRTHKDVFYRGLDAFKKGDKGSAKTLMSQAAILASSIATHSNNKELAEEYGKLSENISKFIQENISKNSTSEDGTIEFAQDSFWSKKIKFNEVKREDKTVSFDDVVGLDDVKEEIQYKVIKPLANPELAKQYKIEPGSKMLLYGPPGTGKTHMARAIAGEVDAKFYAINSKDLIGPYVGESSKRIDALFEQVAKEDRAVIFFDEFDAIASKRQVTGGDGGAEVARMVSTLLTRIDGFKKNNPDKMLLLICATNIPKVIDPAVLRGGRIDTQIYVGLPDEQARRIMVERAFKGVPVAEDFSVDTLVKALDGYGGGDINSICGKIRLEAYKRADKTGSKARVTLADCKKGLSRQRNVITPQMLKEFEEYRNQNKSNTQQIA